MYFWVAVAAIAGLILGIWIGFRWVTWAIREGIRDGKLTEADVRKMRAKKLAESRA